MSLLLGAVEPNKISEEKRILRNGIILISIVYLLSQGFILLLTGTWWDDKPWLYSTPEKMWSVSLQFGKPSCYFIMSFLNKIPQFIWRVLVFVLYYLSTIGVLIIYSQIPHVSIMDAVIMTVIYVIVPVNDARVVEIIFPYIVGFSLFILGFVFLIVYKKIYVFRKPILRITILLLFGCSFILNSCLMFYVIPLLYIALSLLHTNKIRKIYKYVDFVCLPVVFFLLKSYLFPAHGVYENYNTVNFSRIIKSVPSTFIYVFSILKSILGLYYRYLSKGFSFLLGSIFIAFAILLIYRKHDRFASRVLSNNTTMHDTLTMVQKLKVLLTGLFVLYIGIFPYMVVGEKPTLVGVGGRSSILLGTGIAIVIYAVVSLIPISSLRIFVYSIIIVCGIFHFNYFYIMYQQDYYRQLDLTYELKQHKKELSDTKNLLYFTDYNSEIDTTRFYSLNANAMEAFGDNSHFIMNGTNDMKYLNDEKSLNGFVYCGEYLMKDYDIGKSNKVEAIIYYHDGINIRDTIELKFLEITDYDRFIQKLYNERNMDVYIAGTPDFNKKLIEFSD